MDLLMPSERSREKGGAGRRLPISRLQLCAKNAAERYRHSGPETLREQPSGCFGGLLLVSSTVPNSDPFGRMYPMMRSTLHGKPRARQIRR
jgi:hypothetical protein